MQKNFAKLQNFYKKGIIYIIFESLNAKTTPKQA